MGVNGRGRQRRMEVVKRVHALRMSERGMIAKGVKGNERDEMTTLDLVPEPERLGRGQQIESSLYRNHTRQATFHVLLGTRNNG